jgi:hypothetical protein
VGIVLNVSPPRLAMASSKKAAMPDRDYVHFLEAIVGKFQENHSLISLPRKTCP